jgi:hypothetical protein
MPACRWLQMSHRKNRGVTGSVSLCRRSGSAPLKPPLTDRPYAHSGDGGSMTLRRNRGADRFRSPDPEWSAPLVHALVFI